MANSEFIGAGQDTARPAPKTNTITCGDCLDVMQGIPDKSVDMILCDLPYGTTDCKWDCVLPIDSVFGEYFRIVKNDGVVLLFSAYQYSSNVINANPKRFKYKWYWIKSAPRGFANAKKQPLKKTEEILVFYSKQPTYNPQLIDRHPKNIRNSKYKLDNSGCSVYVGGLLKNERTYNEGREIPTEKGYPIDTLFFDTVGNNNKNRFHPSQKPVALCEYLIRTYTNEGDTVLDNCIGSGTTAIACINTGRNYIGIEKEEKYCRIAEERIHALRSPAQNTMEICHTAPNTGNTPC